MGISETKQLKNKNKNPYQTSEMREEIKGKDAKPLLLERQAAASACGCLTWGLPKEVGCQD